jgi:predicted N-formylglutamate amidohydrolase
MLTFLPADPGQAQPFHIVSAAPGADVLVICDHASPQVPARYGTLGLSDETLSAHVAWDIGAARVAILLAQRLRCPAILSGVSRLVIDCNRQPGDPSSIPVDTCGVAVPGNRDVDDAEAQSRAQDWFWPYHQAIGDELARMLRHGCVPAMVSVHSFTAAMNGTARPWHVGVLSNRDRRLADPVLAALRSDSGLVVGDNQPYSGREINYTLDTHAGAAGLPHVSFEIRQDLLADEQGCRAWAERLADVLAPALQDPEHRLMRVF